MATIKFSHWGLCLATAGLVSAAVHLNGPVAGYVAEGVRGELRAITGVPGSFQFSDPLVLPEGVRRIHLAPGQDFALVERGSAGLGVLVLDGGVADSVATIEGAMAAADWAAFSPGAGSAVLYSKSGKRLQVVRGLPDAPKVAIDLAAASLPELPVTAAVSDDGSILLAASGQAVYLVSPAGAAQLLLAGSDFRAVAMLRNGREAVVADAGGGSVHLLQNLNGTPSVRVLASGLDGVRSLNAAWDGKSVYATRPDANSIVAIDVSTGEVQSFASSAAPVELIPLRNRDMFLISAQARQAGWVFFRDGHEGHIVFVPAVSGGKEKGR